MFARPNVRINAPSGHTRPTHAFSCSIAILAAGVSPPPAAPLEGSGVPVPRGNLRLQETATGSQGGPAPRFTFATDFLGMDMTAFAFDSTLMGGRARGAAVGVGQRPTV